MNSTLAWTLATLLALIGLPSCSSSGTGFSPGAAFHDHTAKPAAYTASHESADSSAMRRSRPGLGTEWGAERDAPVTTVSFDRASSRPASVAVLYYNDEAGADAMAAGRYCREILAKETLSHGEATLTVTGANRSPLLARRIGDRLVCIGEKGERYSLLVHNESDRRLEMVLTVDGLDVLDGRSGSFSKRGYILNPGERYSVDGWRMSDHKVATFRFSSVDKSYASKKHHDTRNVGVIGLAVFHEKGPRPVPMPHNSPLTDANPFPASRGRYASPP